MTRRTLVASVALGLIFASVAQAVVLWHTGAELATDQTIAFPTVQPTILDDSAIFGAGDGSDILFSIPLVPAEALGERKFRIVVSLNMTRLTADTDPFFALGDGMRYAGVNIFDNQAGGVGYVQGPIIGTSGPLGMTEVLFVGAGFPEIGEAYDVDIVFRFEGYRLTSEITFRGQTALYSSDYLDPTKALSFMLIRDNEGSE